MKKFPFTKVKQAVLESEVGMLDDFIREYKELGEKEYTKEMSQNKKQLIKDMNKVKNMEDLINLLDGNGFDRQEAFDYICGLVFDFKK